MILLVRRYWKEKSKIPTTKKDKAAAQRLWKTLKVTWKKMSFSLGPWDHLPNNYHRCQVTSWRPTKAGPTILLRQTTWTLMTSPHLISPRSTIFLTMRNMTTIQHPNSGPQTHHFGDQQALIGTTRWTWTSKNCHLCQNWTALHSVRQVLYQNLLKSSLALLGLLCQRSATSPSTRLK